MTETHNLTGNITKQAFETVGHLVVQWSMMEFSLDALIAILFHDFDFRPPDKELPRRFVHKTRFITQVADAGNAHIEPFKKELHSIVGSLGRLSQFRHDVIHGTLTRYEPDTAKYVFLTLDRTKDKLFHLTRERKLTGLELVQVGADAAIVGTRLARLTVTLLKVNHRPDEIKYLLQQFGME